MPRGGSRPGAGRKKAAGKKSAATSKKVERVERVLEKAKPGSQTFDTALDYLRSVWNDSDEDTKVRMQAASVGIAFTNPKIAETRLGKKDMARETAARAASGGKFSPRPPPRLVANNGAPVGKR